jgi:DNA-binding NarL/FixJ family response regulator
MVSNQTEIPRGVVLLVDDHVLIRQATRQLIENIDRNKDVLECANAGNALGHLATLSSAVPARHVALVLLDMGLPDSRDLDTLYAIRRRFPEAPVAIMSANETPTLARAAHAAGAVGFIPKSASAQILESALRILLAGGQYAPPALMRTSAEQERALALTMRQKDVLRCLAQGKSNKEIARILGLGETTIKTHLATIFRVLRVSNRVEAILAAKDLEI